MKGKHFGVLFLVMLLFCFCFINIPISALDADASQTRMIYYFVDSTILDQLQIEIEQFIADVSQDTDSKSKIFISEQSQHPSEIITVLRDGYYNEDLWGAFFIGNVPYAYEQVSGYTNLSDHVYRSLDCPYIDSNNDGIFESASNFSIIPVCNPNIWISRIHTSKQGDDAIIQIRTYFDKNHRLRNDLSYFNNKMFYLNSIGIGEEGKTYDDFIDYFSDMLNDHSLYSANDVTISYETTANGQKNSFVSAFESNYETMKINAHGASTQLFFTGTYDYASYYSSEIAQVSSNVKVIDLDSCKTGHFADSNYFAGELLFSGDTLLVIANPENTFYSDSAFDEDLKGKYYGLGLGFSFADLYTSTYPGSPRHFYGDPTIFLRQKDLQGAPKLLINGSSVNNNSIYELDMGEVFDEGVNHSNLLFKNQGESALKIYGRWVSTNLSYNEINNPISTNGFIFSIIDPSYTSFDFEVIIQPGETKTFTFEFKPHANDDNPGPAQYKAVFKFRVIIKSCV